MDDSKFINEFVSTLPQSGSNSVCDQILEIDYPDYVVDVDNLHLRTNSAITLMKLDGQNPYEVHNTLGQTESSVWFNSHNCRITASMAKEVSCVKSGRARYKLLEKILWGKKLPELKSCNVWKRK
jgi:hypothetical protein